MKVLITSPCSASTIIKYGIKSWPIWECEPSKFKWNYDDKEICLIIEGQAKISTQNGEIYVIKAGDLVEFPAGLNCEWEITKSIKKHRQKTTKKIFYFNTSWNKYRNISTTSCV